MADRFLYKGPDSEDDSLVLCERLSFLRLVPEKTGLTVERFFVGGWDVAEKNDYKTTINYPLTSQAILLYLG